MQSDDLGNKSYKEFLVKNKSKAARIFFIFDFFN